MSDHATPRAEALFIAAVERPPAERDVFLDEACGDDGPLRREVESLLRHHDAAEGFLSAAPGDGHAGHHAAMPLPRRIGSYDVLDVLGEGGMGVVYLARQESPHRTVALKVLRPGLATPARLGRFALEAEMLGRLQHPGIAHIHEAGTADTGHGPQPYFAMERIEGAPLLDFARDHHLDTRQRLRLLLKICDAVQHAHLKGVIHRDLKPGNILVEPSADGGQPKVLDFGVARAVDADVQTTTLRTDVGELLGTIPYMSPEQASGDPAQLDTRSDVYSLGVLAYELLSQRLPYELRNLMIHDAVRVIRETEPTPLSSLSPAFRGDLDTILRKALEKDKERRYQSVSDLAADVRRSLDDEPILARPPSAAYQLAKFARRHTGLVVSASLVGLAIVAGAVVAAVLAVELAAQRNTAVTAQVDAELRAAQAREARRAESEQRELAESKAAVATAVSSFFQEMLESVDPEQARGRRVTVREVLDEAAAGLEGRLAGDPEIEAALRRTIGETYMSLGAYAEALPHLERWVQLRRELSGGEDDEPARIAMTHLADALRVLNRLDESEALLRRVLERTRAAYGPDHEQTLVAESDVALLIAEQGRAAEAEEAYRRVLERQRRLAGPDRSQTLTTMRNLAALLLDKGEFDEGLALLQEVHRTSARTLGPDHPETLGAANGVASALNDAGRSEESLELYEQVVRRMSEVLGPDHPTTLIAMNNQAIVFKGIGNLQRAASLTEEAVARSLEGLGPEHPSTLTFRYTLAGIYKHMDRPEEAERIYAEVLETQRRVLGDRHHETLATIGALGQMVSNRGAHEEAEPLYREALAGFVELYGPEADPTLTMKGNLAVLLGRLDRRDEALPLQREVLDARRRQLGEEHPSTLLAMNNCATSLLKLGRTEQAAGMYTALIELCERHLPAGHHYTPIFRTSLARALVALGRYDEAERHYLDARRGLVDVFGAGHRRVARIDQAIVQLYETWGKPERADEFRTADAAAPEDAGDDG